MDKLNSAGDIQARHRFQSGLLTWLRAAAPQEHAEGLREMIAVTRHLADRSTSEHGAGDGLLWRSAGSFLHALLDHSLSCDDASRALCRRLERHLAGKRLVDGAASENSDALANALFAFVSNRLPNPPVASSSSTPNAPANNERADLKALLGGAFSATADVLPLLGKAKPRRFTDEQLACWREKVAALRKSWHATQVGSQASCRTATTSLVQTALDLSDRASLRIAEAFADAAGAAEEPCVLSLPGFRAAFTAALEVSEHPEGPDQAGFDDSATALAIRLKKAADISKTGCSMVDASAPWFAEDARETLGELAEALDAVPPKRLALLAGFDWFVQHESGKAMAIRGLATTAWQVIGEIRTDDLDLPETHHVFTGVLGALRQAVDEIATGYPPKANEEMFLVLRALEAKYAQRRQQTTAVVPAAKSMVPPLQ